MLGEFIAAQVAANGTARNYQRAIDQTEDVLEKWKSYSKRLEIRLAYERGRRAGWQENTLALRGVLAEKGEDVVALTAEADQYKKDHQQELDAAVHAKTEELEALGLAELPIEQNNGY